MSRTTVSLVLNNVQRVRISPKTITRVLQAAKDLGYVPDAAAQALVNRRSSLVGFVLSRHRRDIASDTFLTQALEGVMDVLHKRDMRLLLDVVENVYDQNSYLKLVKAKHIDGILISGPRFDDEAVSPLVGYGFPVVMMGRSPSLDMLSVDVDNVQAADTVVTHLIGLGHTRIACITNAPLTFTAARDRLDGYRQALTRAGLPYDERLVRFGDFGPESGFEQMNSLLDQQVPFSAAFVASDVVAFGALSAIHQRGLRIPEDMALAGFDDVPMASFTTPPLTSVHLPTTELARQATTMLIDAINGITPVEKHVILDTQVVIRQSCGANRVV